MLAAEPTSVPDLPGLDCGLCGVRTCAELAERLPGRPDLLARCIHLSPASARREETKGAPLPVRGPSFGPLAAPRGAAGAWTDSLGREFDFYLEHFPEEPGPREVILPHNPLLARELEIAHELPEHEPDEPACRQEEEPGHRRHDRREHHLHHGHVVEVEDGHELPRAAEAGAFEEEAEPEAQHDRDRRGRGGADFHRRGKGKHQSHSFRNIQATA